MSNENTNPTAPSAADAALIAELEALKAENQALKKAGEKPITMKVSQKGAVSIYGLQRFPVTLYSNQMTRLLDHEAKIRAFIEEHKDELSVKA